MDVMSPEAKVKDKSHGHVEPRKDTLVARCGGPTKCQQCAFEFAEKYWEADNKLLDVFLDRGEEISRLHTGLEVIKEVLNYATDSSEARMRMLVWVKDSVDLLLVGRGVKHPPRGSDPKAIELNDVSEEGYVKSCLYLEPSKRAALKLLSDCTGVPQTEYVRQGIDLVLQSIATMEMKVFQKCPSCNRAKEGWPIQWGNVPIEKGGTRYVCGDCVKSAEGKPAPTPLPRGKS